MQRDVGVGGAGRRVADRPGGGSTARTGRRSTTRHRRHVDPGDGEALAVGRPPVARGAAHLLGGDELRRAPGDVRVVLGGHDRSRCPSSSTQRRRGAGHVGDAAPARVRSGVERPAPTVGQLAHLTGREVGDPGLGCQLERRPAAAAVGRVRHDPGRGLPRPLPPGPLLRRHARPRRQSPSRTARVGHEALPALGWSPSPTGTCGRPRRRGTRSHVTSSPSLLTATSRGRPSVNRWVRAYRLGKLSPPPLSLTGR